MAKPNREDILLKAGLALAVATELAKSVSDDVKEQRHVSDETIILVENFFNKCKDLEGILDAINGVN